MPRLMVFNSISLDGYFTDAHGDMSWAHRGSDEEWDAFTTENATGGGALVFGRVTFEMMAGFWTTPEAFDTLPVVAQQMNDLFDGVRERVGLTLTESRAFGHGNVVLWYRPA